jgi:hypothetical protein
MATDIESDWAYKKMLSMYHAIQRVTSSRLVPACCSSGMHAHDVRAYMCATHLRKIKAGEDGALVGMVQRSPQLSNSLVPKAVLL